jgi:Trypsin-co-occurring domain 2
LLVTVHLSEVAMPSVEDDNSRAELSDAIEALRNALARAWYDGRQRRVRFKIEPIELTIQVGVTKTGKGSAGIVWHVLTLGGERSREAATTQTLKLRLAPLLFDDEGNLLAETEQLISDEDASRGFSDHPTKEPE